MVIAINSTSLNVNNNVSGVSTLIKNIIQDNKEVHYIHLLVGRADNEKGLHKRIAAIAVSYSKLLKLVMSHSFDLLHLNIALYPKSVYRDVVTFTICKLFRREVIVHLHGGTYLFKKPKNPVTTKLINYLLTKADKVIILSELEGNAIAELYDVSNSAVLSNAVDTSIFKPESYKKINEKIKFLFLGRLHQSKGLELLVTAFEKLAGKGHPVELIICGNGPLKQYVETKAKDNKAIEFRGVVSGKEKIDVINECDIFLLPSLYGEGLPMALLEAMACGLVPIVSTDGSMKLIIEHESNGLLVKPGDLNDLKGAMEKVIKDKVLMAKISGNARETILDKYNWDGYLIQLNGLYATIYPNKI